ncbi:MAG: DUF1003 domain-containing protein [Candidatus Doudnabacteria bacterium]|nr:DUF1003 domain-containing protein [Candidatus Doudnabacteria bacterium]
MVKRIDQESLLERYAFRLTKWMGSIPSILLHTVLFVAAFSSWFFGVEFDTILLLLTTIVSLEAIYLSLFIQMTVNRNTESLEEVEEDIDEIQKDIDEVQEDVGEIAEDVEGIEKDVDEIQADIDEVQKDIDEVQKDVDEIQEDVEEITEEETAEDAANRKTRESLEKIETTLGKLMEEIEKIKGSK